MPEDMNRSLLVKVKLATFDPGPPRRCSYVLTVRGGLPRERLGLTLAFYDGAEPGGGSPEPGKYQVLEYDLGLSPDFVLTVSLPTEHAGWAVREARAGGVAWPFSVVPEGPEAPGSTPAGPQDAVLGRSGTG